jgi:hypothetical protein
MSYFLPCFDGNLRIRLPMYSNFGPRISFSSHPIIDRVIAISSDDMALVHVEK